MSDLWADVREEEFAIWLADGPDNAEIQEKVAAILTDADALLPLLRYAQHRIGCPWFLGDGCDCGLNKIIAALPEYLK